MRKIFKKIFSGLLSLMIASMAVSISEFSHVRATEGETTGTTAADIQLDIEKFSIDSAKVSLGYVEVTQNSSSADYANVASSAEVAATLRVGLGGMDLSEASSFRFLMKSGAATRMKFGFIDGNGTAYLVNQKLSYQGITFLDYSLGSIRESEAQDLNYLGVRFNNTEDWGASYVCLTKEMFSNALSFTTGAGVAWGYGYSEGEESATIDWTDIDSVFVEFVSEAPYNSWRNFYSLDMVDESGTVSEVVNANNLTEIEKPAYNATDSGYEKNEYSFGSRPVFTEANDHFSCKQEDVYHTVKGGLTGDTTAWTTDGVACDLSGHNALSFYVDTTDTSITGQTEIQWYIKNKEDSGEINYGGNTYSVRIPDGGEMQIVSTGSQYIPAGFKGRVIIPFTNFHGNNTTFDQVDRSGVVKTLLAFTTKDNGVASDATCKIIVKDARYIADYETEITNYKKEAIAEELETFSSGFYMREGASLRIKKDDWGMRFEIDMDQESLIALRERATELGVTVEVGALLAPTATITENGTVAELTKANAAASLVPTVWATENQAFYATLDHDTLVGHLEDSVTVRGYCTLAFGDGSEITVYTEYTVDNDGNRVERGGQVSRSIVEVAENVDNAFEEAFGDKTDAGKAYAFAVLQQIYPQANGYMTVDTSASE